MVTLTLAEQRERAQRLRVVLTDVDGVLTDGGVYYGEHGEVMKRFSVRDGMGVERLRNAGIQTAFVTRETSKCVEARSRKLALPHYFAGVPDKAGALPGILDVLRADRGEVAYIGDDVNDAGVMDLVHDAGLTGAPADAVAEIRARTHFVATAPGGHGAFREFAEWLLSLRTAPREP